MSWVGPFPTTYVHKKGSIFKRIKTSKEKKVACLKFCAFFAFYAFYAFCVHKKHLSESRLLAFYAFYAGKNIWVKFACLTFSAFCAFFFVWSLFVKKNKTALIPSFILLLKCKRKPLEIHKKCCGSVLEEMFLSIQEENLGKELRKNAFQCSCI